jgi:hypothetical protein
MVNKIKMTKFTLNVLILMAVAAVPPAGVFCWSLLAGDRLATINRGLWLAHRMVELCGKLVWSG